MTYPFKIRIWDRHWKQEVADGELMCLPKDDNWYRFDFTFDLNKLQITAFQEFVLFGEDDLPQRCVEIFFSDESSVFGAYSHSKFTEVYEKEYTELFSKWIGFANELNNTNLPPE